MTFKTSIWAAVAGVALLAGCADGERKAPERQRGGGDPAASAGGGQHGGGGHGHHRHGAGGHVEDGGQDLLPGRVKSAFTQEFPNATIKDVEKRAHEDGTVHWEIRFETEQGETRTVEFDTDGKLVR